MRIAIDFDGVLSDSRDAKDLKARPMPGALEGVRSLLDAGHTLFVFTARKDLGMVQIWLDKWGFPPMEVTNVKQPWCDVLLDDRAVRFTNWEEALTMLSECAKV